MRTLFDAFRSLLYAAGFIFVWGWIALSVRQYDSALGVTLPVWTRVPGIVFMVLGGMIALTCVGTFAVRGQGTPAPFDAPRKLVAVGIYRWVRNPMYLGGALVLAGFAFFEGSVSILLLAVAMWLAANLFVHFYEEPTLRKNFGDSYEDYCREVSRWLPRPPRSHAN